MRYLKTYKLFESNNDYLTKWISDWRKTNSNLYNDFLDYCTPGITQGDEYTHKKWTLAMIFGTSLIDSYKLDKNHPLLIEYMVRIVEGEDPLNVISDVSKRVPGGIDPNDFLLTRLKELKGYNESLDIPEPPINEPTITKSELVDKIRWYSNYVHQYMKDVNKFTTSNLNFSFSYDTELTISQIFDAADMLHHDSPDGFITAVCNEFITWSNYFMRNHSRSFKEQLGAFNIDEEYDNYTDEYKKENRSRLYKQEINWLIYAATGRDIKEMIDGTIWDIPVKKKFSDEDNEFIVDCIVSDLCDINDEYIKPISDTMRLYHDVNLKTFKFGWMSTKRGIIFKIPSLPSFTSIYTQPDRAGLSYDSDFINRLQSYFSGALILDRGAYSNNIRIYLPFYE